MKQIITISICCFFINATTHAQARFYKKDSAGLGTDHEQFVANVLKETTKKNRWLLISVDSCNTTTSMRIIDPRDLYAALSKRTTGYTHDQFVYDVSNDIALDRIYSNCETALIVGQSIDAKVFSKIEKLSDKKLLQKYFDKERLLQRNSYNVLAEIIASCFKRSIKVITPINGAPYYEISQ